MKQEEAIRLENSLSDVPHRTVLLERRTPSGSALPQPLQAQTDGRGRLEIYGVFPGIEAAFHRFWAGRAAFHHAASRSVLEIYHCRTGRVGWNMRGGTEIYLGAGDLTIHSTDCCADSVMLFPMGYSEGISMVVDLERMARVRPEILEEAGVRAERLQEKFCAGKPAAIPACPELDGIFAPLYTAPPPLRLPYLKLKSQELLLYLDRLGPENQELTQYVSQQTERVREIHRLLTEHLDRRYTIEELSKRCLINTSTLKEVFKAVYGLPIATYMKEYRVQRAMKLLRETNESIAHIAAQVGYETQSKFTKAFKDVVQVPPTEYRKQQQGRRTV